jgi:hypothetical protein
MNSPFPQVEKDKDVFEVAIQFNEHSLNKTEIGLSLGYARGIIPKHFKIMVDDIILQLPHRCDIKAGYRILPLKIPTDRFDSIEVDGTFFKVHKIVASQLKKAESAALFVCTIGAAMENWSRELIRTGDPALGYLVDAIASVATEQAIDMLHDHIGRQMSLRSLKITNRYSPGYCNWSVAEQHLLFSKFPPNFCGIRLTESALMVPIKSVSGIIGIGTAVKRKEYLCATCGMKDCTYRAIRVTKSKRTVKAERVQMNSRGKKQ